MPEEAKQIVDQDISHHFDVIIVGAGPAGATCALALEDSGLQVAILDKAGFPRDKVCGDSIPGRSVKLLGQIDPRYQEILSKFPHTEYVSATRVVSSSGKQIIKYWNNRAYNCKRMEFDNLLFDWVKSDTKTTVFENTELQSVTIESDKVLLKTSSGNFSTDIIVGCDGAHSLLAKKLAGFTVDKYHYAGAVRAYHSNITGSTPNQNEIFFSKKAYPGYFWLFPLPDNSFNIGFGMLSKAIAEKKMNLKESLVAVIEEFPELTQRFSASGPIQQIDGFGLPLGSRDLPLSGNRFLLCGDAASLIDPLSGDGIGNAMTSGKIAAEHIRNYFSKGNFDAITNQAYDKAVYRTLGQELKRNTRLLRISSRFPWLLNSAIAFLSKKNFVSRYLLKKL